MRLKTFALISGLIIAVAGELIGTYISITTDYLSEQAAGIRARIDSMYAAEELEVALLSHSRAAFLASVSPDPRYERYADDAMQQVNYQSEAISQFATSPAEKTAAAEARSAVDAYKNAVAKAASAETEPLAGFFAAGPYLESAYQALERLVDIDMKQASLLRTRAEHANRIGDMIGTAVAVTFVVGAGIAVLLSRRLLYQPLLAVSKTIQRFGKGETTLRASADDGMYELREIATVFNEMADGLEKQRESRLRFLASIAHDLRNPLGAIHMSTDLLLVPGASDDKHEMVGIIRRQVTQLERLVGDLLDTVRIEGGNLDVAASRQDLRTLAQEVTMLFRSVATQHQVRAEMPDEAVWANVDPQRLGQVLNNLMSNAIKYSPYGGEIAVSVQRNKDEAVITVSDQGMGIAADDLQRIFEPFRRTKATRETIPGVGLGLSVSRKIVEAHGGHIKVDSVPGKGSRFELWLPATR